MFVGFAIRKNAALKTGQIVIELDKRTAAGCDILCKTT